MQKWIQPTACLDRGLHVLKPRFFSAESCSKNAGFFHQINVHQPIGRPGSMQTGWSEQTGGWIHFRMKRLRILKSFKIFKSEKVDIFSRPIQWYHCHEDPIWPDGEKRYKKNQNNKKRRAQILEIHTCTLNSGATDVLVIIFVANITIIQLVGRPWSLFSQLICSLTRSF